MLKSLLKLRYLYIVVVVFNAINSVAYLAVGVYKSIHGYIAIFESMSHHDEWGNPGIHLAEALDAFLISIIFLIFAFGVYKIFLSDNTKESNLPKWLDIKSLSDLKLLLWEGIVVSLLVFTLTVIFTDIDNPSWDMLILPAIVFLLTVGLILLRIWPKARDDN